MLNGLGPEEFGEVSGIVHSTCMLNEGTIKPFGYAILLGCVMHGKAPYCTFRLQMLIEFRGYILSPSITLESL